LKLYGMYGSCAQTIHIILREVGEPFDYVQVDLRSKTLADGSDYGAVAPRRQVPVLVLDDGAMLTELAAIAQFLADRHPETVLLPRLGTHERYQALSWLSYVGSELHKGISPIIRPDTPDAYRSIARTAVETKLGWLDAQMEGRTFLADHGFGLADAYLFVVLGWLPMLGMDMAAWPNLRAFRQRIAGRPAVAATLDAEGIAA
jgi:glutathione S-transferase